MFLEFEPEPDSRKVVSAEGMMTGNRAVWTGYIFGRFPGCRQYVLITAHMGVMAAQRVSLEFGFMQQLVKSTRSLAMSASLHLFQCSLPH